MPSSRGRMVFSNWPNSKGAPLADLRRNCGRWHVAALVAALAACQASSPGRAAEPPQTAAAELRGGLRGQRQAPSSRDGSDVERPRREVRYTDGRLHIEPGAPTLGGVQLWGDEFWYGGWHIQRNALTGHCRLLDANNRREDWGSFEQCLRRFEELKRTRELPPMKGRAVILLHGLGGWHSTMQPLADYLQENSELAVVNLTYPSTRADVASHARALASVVAHLNGIEELDFVAHSLGNIVLRRFLADLRAGGVDEPRIKRIVMLAPPNHGSLKAEKWSDKDLFVAVLGASAVQLGSGWSELEKQLAVPAGEFGIIAGGRGDDRGYSSRLPGDDDNTLSVDATRLAGARDFKIVPAWHSFLVLSPTVHRMTLEFLERGYFVSEADRTPLVDRPPPRDAPASE